MLHHLPVAVVKFVHKSDLHQNVSPICSQEITPLKIRLGNEDLIQATKKHQW
jgi:hypothetical protein